MEGSTVVENIKVAEVSTTSCSGCIESNSNSLWHSEEESSCSASVKSTSNSINENGNGGVTTHNNNDVIITCHHHRIPCKFRCHDCNAILCSECVLDGHVQHYFEKSDDLRSTQQEILCSLKNDAVEFYKTIKTLRGRANYQKQCLTDCLNQTKLDVHELHEQLVSLVDAYCDSLVADMKDEYSHTLSTLTNLITAASRLREPLKSTREQVRHFCAGEPRPEGEYERLRFSLVTLTEDMHTTLAEYAGSEWPDRIVIRVDDDNLGALQRSLQELKTVYFATQSKFLLSSDFEYSRPDDEDLGSMCSVLNTVPPYWDPDTDFPLTGAQIDDTEILTWDNRLCCREDCAQCFPVCPPPSDPTPPAMALLPAPPHNLPSTPCMVMGQCDLQERIGISPQLQEQTMLNGPVLS